MAKRYKVMAECSCNKQEIDIKELTNKYGYIEKIEWQCPNCWNIVDVIVRDNEEQDND